MSFLVTGASGFVGSAVVRELIGRGERVKAILGPSGDMRRLTPIWKGKPIRECVRYEYADRPAITICGDLTIKSEIGDEIDRTEPPETVIHCAWSGTTRDTWDDPKQLENVTSSLALYHKVKALGCKRFVALGSLAENHSPLTQYAQAKVALRERLAIDEDAIWFTVPSVYGPDDRDWLVPYLIKAKLTGHQPLLKTPWATVNVAYVDDVAKAICNAAQGHGEPSLSASSMFVNDLHSLINGLTETIDWYRQNG